MLYKEGFEVSYRNLKLLYESQDFIVAILKDYGLALLFTVLGIIGMIKSIKIEYSPFLKYQTVKNKKKK